MWQGLWQLMQQWWQQRAWQFTHDGHSLLNHMQYSVLKCAHGSRLLVYLRLVRQVSGVHVSGKLEAASGDRGRQLT